MRTKLLSLKTLLVICLMAIVGGVETWADTYKYTSDKEDYSSYSSGIFSFVSGNVTWTGKTNYAKPSNEDTSSKRGTQFGTKSSTNCSLSLSTSDIVGTIQSIVVNTATAKGCTVNLSVSVGGKEVGKKTLTGTSADYTFTPTITTSGEIVLSWSTAKGSVYLKSITITYTPSSGSSVAAPTFSDDSKSFSDKFDLKLSAGSDAAMIMYTTDGSTPSYKNGVGELYETPISITHTTTVKAIAVSSKGEESDVVTKEYKLKLPAPIISEATKIFIDPFTVSLSTKATAAEGILYTLDGTDPSLENNAPKKYTEPIQISATTTLKAVSYATNGTTYEYSPIATATYTKQGDDPIVIWSEDWSAFKEGNKPTKGENATYVCKDGASATKIYNGTSAGGVSPELLINKKGGSLAITINDLKGANEGLIFTFKANSSNKTNFIVSADNATKIDSTTVQGASAKKFIRTYIFALDEGATSLTITLNNSSSDNVRVDDLELSTYSGVGSFKITEAGYGTYYSSKAYTMPEGVKGYTITGNEGTSLVMNEAYAAGAVVPAKTALVVEGAANKYYTLVAESTELTPDNNKLHGSDEAETTYVDGTDVKYYKLSYNNEGNNLGFYWGSENGAAFTNGAHKAYLALDSETLLSQSRGFSLADLAHGVTTGINTTVKSATQSNFIYDLNGRRINSLNGAAKGVYIMNCQKVLVK